ncbi:NfeD family protein [Streptomyces sp. B6B3]|uniref:NfeD family protein n=1 Tax=Streptomyces sp. B6B3 TaxID=3153570 RepID=UPI00325EDA22
MIPSGWNANNTSFVVVLIAAVLVVGVLVALFWPVGWRPVRMWPHEGHGVTQPEALVGRTGVVDQAAADGYSGQVRLAGASWTVRTLDGGPVWVGQRIRVTGLGREGVDLVVETEAEAGAGERGGEGAL